MRAIAFLVLVVLGLAGCERAKAPGEALAEWAYPHSATSVFAPLPPGAYTVPGSRVTMTAAQAFDDNTPPDWFPDRHPPGPGIVMSNRAPLGRPGGPTPCGACHLVTGQGFLGSPNLAGLPAAYIEQQVRDFREGRRRSWSADLGSTKEMIKVAEEVNDTELAEAAQYFASLKMTLRYRVVESDTAPAVAPDKYGWLDVIPGKPREPLRGRNIEVADDFKQLLLADPNYVVTVYVPRGAVARGASLAASGGGAGQPCAGCHGEGLKGAGEAPPLAGRSAAYLARQLWDMHTGARGGPSVAQMQPVAAKLGEADIANLSAYLASLSP